MASNYDIYKEYMIVSETATEGELEVLEMLTDENERETAVESLLYHRTGARAFGQGGTGIDWSLLHDIENRLGWRY